MLLFYILVLCKAATNLTIGIDVTNLESLSFVGNLEKHYDQFAEKGLSIEIQYHILPCYTCASRHQYTKSEKNCLGGGRYCQYSPLVDGQLLLTEIIRQQCIFQTDVKLYLSYMNLFSRDCLENQHYTFCSANILTKHLNLEEDFEQCIEDSFEGDGDKSLKLNKILQAEKDKQNNSSKLSITLNDFDVTEQANHFINLLCESLSDPPQYCDILIAVESNYQLKLQDELQCYLFLIFVCGLLFVAVGCLKNLKNNGKQQISIYSEEKMHIIEEDQVI